MKHLFYWFRSFLWPFFVTLLVLNSSFLVNQVHAESTVRGGDGFAESQLILSILKFPKLVEICLNTPENIVNCHFSPDINLALKRCQADSQFLIDRVSDVLFGTELEHPEWFPPNQRKQFYFNNQNKKIYFNRDMLYRSGANGLKYPLQLIEIVPITVKVVASLANCLVGADIDRVAQNIASAAYTSLVTVEFGNAADELRIYDPKNKVRLLHFGSDSRDSQLKWGSLYLQDGLAMYLADQAIADAVDCPESKLGRYAVTRLENKFLRKTNQGAQLLAQFNLAYSCRSDMTTFERGVFQINAIFKNKVVLNPRNEDDIALQLIEKSVKVSVVAD